MATREFILMRLGAVLAGMAVVSEAPAGAELDHIQGSETGLPAGVGVDDPTLLDEWLGIMSRVCDVAEVELERRRGRVGPVGRAEDQDERIRHLWRGHPPRFVAFVEDVSEKHVRRLLEGREVLS